MKLSKHITNIYNSLHLTRVFVVAICLVMAFNSVTVRAELPTQARDAINGNWAEWVTDDCIAGGGGGSTSGTSASGPGKVFVIGDSIGNGLTNYNRDSMPLASALGDGWSVSGDSKDGRPLSEGIKVANSAPQGLKDAKYVLVVQGSNLDTTKGNRFGISEMVDSIRAANKDAAIFWLGTNLQPGTLIDTNEDAKAEEFNGLLSEAGGITVINNTVTPSADGVHPNYSELAPVVASGLSGGVASNVTTTGETPASGAPASSDTTDTPESSTLSIRDKLATLIFARANTVDEIKSATSAKVGGLFVRPSNSNDAATYNGIKSALGGTTPLISVDFEGGRVQAPGKDLVGELPSAAEMGKKSEEEIKTLGKLMGTKLAAYGINMDFAPVVDIGGTNNAVIGDRAFANTADEVTKKAGAFAAGLSEAGIISNFKHFPGHGSREGDSHKGPVGTASLSELEGRDIKPYQTLLKNAKASLMMGHLKVPEWGDTATSMNPQAYDYVRKVLGFNGVIVTDALDMQGITSPADQPSRALLAIQSGADMALLSSTSQVVPTLDKLEAAIKSGSLDEKKVDEAVARINGLKGVASAQDATGKAGCFCSAPGSGAVPIDGENPKRVFQYFLSVGYSPEQAAGVVGNMMHESGVEPQRLQGTSPGTITPASEAVGSSLGWGLVQWTPAGKMINPVGIDKADTMEAQLEFLKQQLDGETVIPEKAAGDKVKAATSIEEATLAFISFERFKNWNNSAGEPERQERIASAKAVFDQYSGLSASAASASSSSSGGCGGGSGVAGATCPANLEEHPSQKGYYKMPEAPNGEYVIYSNDARRYGSKQLVCTLYTVGLAYKKAMGDESTLYIGDLNASGHKSHNKGIAVDLLAQGNKWAASQDGGEKYNTEATILLGKMFVDSGVLRNIWWCEPGANDDDLEGDDGSMNAIRDYAKSKNALEGQLKCISGHKDHFHVDIKQEYILGNFTP